MNPVRAIPAGDEHLAAPAMLHLRPHHGTVEALAAAMAGQRASGYLLLGSFAGDGPAAAVAGYRIVENLAWGRLLYVDDLVTDPGHRGGGHATRLLAALDAEAAAQGCAQLHLDSGVGDDRRDAHRRYFGHGMRISAYHFSKPVPGA